MCVLDFPSQFISFLVYFFFIFYHHKGTKKRKKDTTTSINTTVNTSTTNTKQLPYVDKLVQNEKSPSPVKRWNPLQGHIVQNDLEDLTRRICIKAAAEIRKGTHLLSLSLFVRYIRTQTNTQVWD